MSSGPDHGRHVVVRTIERAPGADIAGLGDAGTATVHEAIGRRGYLGPELQPIQQGVKVAGSAGHRRAPRRGRTS